MRFHTQFALFLLPLMLCGQSYAGGPLLVAGTGFDAAANGKPVVWDTTAGPVKYRVPSAGSLGKLDNATAVARVQRLFQIWEDVTTAKIAFSKAGNINSTGAYTGGAVDTAAKFNAVEGSCANGTQSPIVFDANGSLFTALGFDDDVIGFAGPCVGDFSGHITAAEAVLNGKWIDGNQANGELSDNQFDEAFVHEFGHFIGLDHSQINVAVLNEPLDQCSSNLVEALPVMFPFAHCQARRDLGFNNLSADDEAWVSMLYPEDVDDPTNKHERFDQKYGFISGDVLFTKGDTAQGVNVIAQSTSNTDKVSVVSGYLYTGNPGLQQVTGDNDGDGGFGSHNLARRGEYTIPVKAGSYTVIEEPISPEFVGGSSVGPLFPFAVSPAPESSSMSVVVGSTTNLDITLTDSQPRFDQFEGK